MDVSGRHYKLFIFLGIFACGPEPQKLHEQSASVQAQAPDASLQLRVITGVDASWQTITLDHTYQSMVVACTPHHASTSPASPAHQPTLVRVNNAAADRFDVRVQTPGDPDVSTPTTVHCLVAEAGSYPADETGLSIEAGIVADFAIEGGSAHGQQTVTLGHPFQTPVVVAQVMSQTDRRWSSVWAQASDGPGPPRGNTFVLGRQAGDKNGRLPERIGYLAIKTGHGLIGDYNVFTQVAANISGVDDSASGFRLPISSESASTQSSSSAVQIHGAIVSASSRLSDQVGWPVVIGNQAVRSELYAAIDVPAKGDQARTHPAEHVAYLALTDTRSDPSPPDVTTQAPTEDAQAPTVTLFGPLQGDTVATDGHHPARFYAGFTDDREGKLTSELTDTAGNRIDDGVTIFANGLEVELPSTVHGKQTYRLHLTDAAGNRSETDHTVFVDATIPVTTLTPGAGIYHAAFTIAMSVSEDADVYYTTDGNPPVIGAANTEKITLAAGDTHSISVSTDTVIHFFAIDDSGNLESLRTARYLLSDRNPPPTAVTAVLGNGGSHQVSWQAPSSDIDVPITEYRVYHTVNAVELSLLRASHDHGHPVSAHIPYHRATKTNIAMASGVVPAWVAVSAVNASGRETHVSDPIALAPGPMTEATPQPTPQQTRAVSWLLSQQHEDGWWGDKPSSRIRLTAMALHALYLKKHISTAQANPLMQRQSWPVKRGLGYLSANLRGADTYDLSLAMETLAMYGRSVDLLAAELLAKSDAHPNGRRSRLSDHELSWGRRPFYKADVLTTARVNHALKWSGASTMFGLTGRAVWEALGDPAHTTWPGRYGPLRRSPATVMASSLVYPLLAAGPDTYDWITDSSPAEGSPPAEGTLGNTAMVLKWVPFSDAAKQQQRLTWLLGRQTPNGSFGDDIWTTALALQGWVAATHNLASFARATMRIVVAGGSPPSIGTTLPKTGGPIQVTFAADIQNGPDDTSVTWKSWQGDGVGFAAIAGRPHHTKASFSTPGQYVIHAKANILGRAPLSAGIRVTVHPRPGSTTQRHLVYTTSEIEDGLRVSPLLDATEQAIELRSQNREVSFVANRTPEASVKTSWPGEYLFETRVVPDRTSKQFSLAVGVPRELGNLPGDTTTIALPLTDPAAPLPIWMYTLQRETADPVRLVAKAPPYAEGDLRHEWQAADNSDAFDVEPGTNQATLVLPGYGHYRVLVTTRNQGVSRTSYLHVHLWPKRFYDTQSERVVSVGEDIFFRGDPFKPDAVWESLYSAGPVQFFIPQGEVNQKLTLQVPGRYVVRRVSRKNRDIVYQQHVIRVQDPAMPVQENSITIDAGGSQTLSYDSETKLASTEVSAFVFANTATVPKDMSWHVVNAAGGVQFANAKAARTQVHFDALGDYTLAFRVTIGDKTYEDTIDVTVAPPTGGDLLLHWTFDDIAGERVIDQSGQDHHGAVTGGVALTPTGVEGNQAFSFSGEQQLETEIADGGEQLLEQYTLSLWVRLPSITHAHKDERIMHILSWSDDARFEVTFNKDVKQDLFRIHIPSQRLYFRGKEDPLPKSGKWVHLAVVYHGQWYIRSFFQGELKTAYGKPKTASHKEFGAANFGRVVLGQSLSKHAAARFIGDVDDVRLYQRAMSEEEVWLLCDSSPLSQPGECKKREKRQ